MGSLPDACHRFRTERIPADAVIRDKDLYGDKLKGGEERMKDERKEKYNGDTERV